jgi:hypothetical protein
MVTKPPAFPDTTPVKDPTDAKAVLLLAQMPPGTGSVSEII